jgi:MauM/NapG family ferredoxin protein
MTQKQFGSSPTVWRRISQALFLIIFLFLFRTTDYSGKDELPYAVNVFFRWDPLVAAAAMLAAKTVIALALPSLVLVAWTAIVGRFFCGWICPLGTLLDVAHRFIRPAGESAHPGRYRAVKYGLLVIILVSAFFSVPLVGLFDPFSILVRGLGLSVDPAFNWATTGVFDWAYRSGPTWLSNVTEPTYAFLRGTLLPFRQTTFMLALVALVILGAIFALERLERRFWCRNVCPLGALYALVARHAPLKWQPGRACHSQGCHTCGFVCPMGAIDATSGEFSPESCNLCLDCQESCPQGLIHFAIRRRKPKPAPFDLSRRAFLVSVAAGAVLPAFVKATAAQKLPNPWLIRPPGALAEPDFVARCVRCGECMKVCINNALHPAGFEAGVEGIFSPRLSPRLGYCEYNCTLCGQVCPTGAIRRLPLIEKQRTVLGRAIFDHNRCLPWAKGTPCLVCQEHCPTPDKAIRLRPAIVIDQGGNSITLQQPYVVDNLCIGCGICENKCPLSDEAAVRVTREGESRNPDNAVGVGYSL